MAYNQERRNALAREKGFASYSAYRKASPSERAAASERLARTDPTYKGSGRAVEAAQRAWAARHGARQIIPTPAGTYLRTTAGGKGEGVVLGQLDRRGDANVARIVVRYVGEDGQVHVVEVERKGGSADSLADRMRLAGGVKDYAAGVVDASAYVGVSKVLGVELVLAE